MIQDLTDLALNKIPIRLGSLINSVEVLKKPNKYRVCIECEEKIYGYCDKSKSLLVCKYG